MASAEKLIASVDIGATGIKAAAFYPDGRPAAIAGRPNGPVPQPGGHADWLIWDAEQLWAKASSAIKEVTVKTGGAAITGIAVTGFGTDGAFIDADGALLYPIISWHDSRTLPERDEMNRLVGNRKLYQITGYHNYPINTVNRWLWFRHNHPEILEKAHRWLQVQDYIAYRLSGSASTEATIASTTMALDMSRRDWSSEILDAVGIGKHFLSPISQSGITIGEVTSKAAELTGLVAGTPVVTGGHDCEIAALGAAVSQSTTFVDINGTWEIILAIVDQFRPDDSLYDLGLDFEAHAVPGQYICQGLMIAGAVIEWIRRNLYAGDAPYEQIMAEAEDAGIGSGGVFMLPSFVRGSGPAQSFQATGSIIGLTTASKRGQLIRAALEGLCFQLKQQMTAIEGTIGLHGDRIRVVGGGQRNRLWLQMKADVTGRPVEVTSNEEVTLLGAALLAGVGAGLYKDMGEALAQLHFTIIHFEPVRSAHDHYAEIYESVYRPFAPALQSVYAASNRLTIS